LGASRPEVLGGEDRRDDEQDGECGHASPFQSAPRLEPQRQTLPHRGPDPLAPRTRHAAGIGTRPRLGSERTRVISSISTSTDLAATTVAAVGLPGPPSRRSELPSVRRAEARSARCSCSFGEERLGPSAERLRRCLMTSAPAAGVVPPMTRAPVGDGTPARAAGRDGCT
jgi:hypothetical protein